MKRPKEISLKVVQTARERYGSDYYARIGSMGGKSGGSRKGFASKTIGKDGLTGPERAAIVGKLGGYKSPKKNVTSK